MRKRDIYITILAGGKGERLWPKSRAYLPKQNLRFFGKGTTLQDTVERAKKISPRNISVIATKENSYNTRKQLRKFRIKRIVVEPFGRNTAPAIGLAALLAFRENRGSLLVAMPGDHIIKGNKGFLDTIKSAIKEADKNNVVVTLGIKPTSPEGAYGYIEAGKRNSRNSYKAVRFIEKPRPALAGRLIKKGRFFWNSGIFVFKASAMLSMLKRHVPALYRGLIELPSINDKSKFDKELKRLYKKIKSESLDYAVLEKTRDICVIPSNFEWNDIGSFNNIARLLKKDKDGNAVFGNYAAIDTKNCIIASEANHLVGTIGIKDLIIIQSSDAILVCDRKRAQDIKRIVKKIKAKDLTRFL